MRTMVQDLRYAIRSLVKQPGFTVVALVTLALGIGANTAIFGIVNAVLLRPLPYREPRASSCCGATGPTGTGRGCRSPSWSTTRTRRRRSKTWPRSVFVVQPDGRRRAAARARRGRAGRPLRGARRRPLVGRVFTADEDQPGHEHVVMLGEGLWRSQFGGDPSIVGRTIQLDGAPYTVVGVLPASAKLPLDYASRATTDLWVPLALGAPTRTSAATTASSRSGA